MSSRTRSPGAKKQASKPSMTFVPSVPAVAPVKKIEPKPSAASGVLAFVEVWWPLIFAVCCLSMQCLVEPKQGWAWPPKLDLSGKQAMSVFTSQWFWICWAPMLLGVAWVQRTFQKHAIPIFERGMMVWWLTNAFFFHIQCDVMSGYYQVMPAMTELYKHISPAHEEARWADARLHLDTTYWLELYVEAPFAIVCLLLYIYRHPARHFVETFAVSVQFAGTFIYYVPRFIRHEEFTSWLCFFDNGFGFVWIAFPVFVLVRHCLAVTHASAVDKKS